MLFNSFHFLVFFAVVGPIAIALRNRVRSRNWFILAASYYFYGCWDWRFLGLMCLSTLVDYGVGRALEHVGEASQARRRRILLISLAFNLGILGFFKYFNFFIDSTTALLAGLGWHVSPPLLNIVLPVGISFYTFQALSYTIEVYRRRIPCERSLLNFAVYVAIFPQLVAGPIERAAHLLPQVREPSRVSWAGIQTGVYLAALGLFKKVVVADNVAQVADGVFGAAAVSGPVTLVGLYAFALQIYFDFSAYSDIARGVARIMGFDLMRNFNQPYLAVDPSDFWERWHISLSSWLRHYLYFSLGGNRKGTRRTYVNLMLTMTLGGLWHGANWTFLFWGIYHGALLVAYRAVGASARASDPPALGLWARRLLFFHLVCLGWLFFRAESLSQVGQLLASFGTGWSAGLPVPHRAAFFGCAAVWIALEALQWRAKGDELFLMRFPIPVRSIAYACMFLAFIWFGDYGGQSFIYFQF
jgi:alginate O-acetyltransferase complex protein AlgI